MNKFSVMISKNVSHQIMQLIGDISDVKYLQVNFIILYLFSSLYLIFICSIHLLKYRRKSIK